MSLPQFTEMPEPQYIMSAEGYRIATYTWGDDADETVVIVHGFASSTRDNWVSTGWVRDLLRAGYRVLGIDQRGHGASDKPHDARAYGVRALVADIEAVLDTYLVDRAHYVGYSLGARIGWDLVQQREGRIERVVLGGVPDGIPLARLDLEQVRGYVRSGVFPEHTVTQNYIRLVERVPGNDVAALLALAEAMRASAKADGVLGDRVEGDVEAAVRRDSPCSSRRDRSTPSSRAHARSQPPARRADSSRSPTGTTSMRPDRACSAPPRWSSSPRSDGIRPGAHANARRARSHADGIRPARHANVRRTQSRRERCGRRMTPKTPLMIAMMSAATTPSQKLSTVRPQPHHCVDHAVSHSRNPLISSETSPRVRM